MSNTLGHDFLSGSRVDVLGDVARGVSRGDVQDRVASELGMVGEDGVVLSRQDADFLGGGRWGGCLGVTGHRRGGGQWVRSRAGVIQVRGV